MSGALQILLNSSHPMFASSLRDLERTVGGSGVDTRLIADMLHAAHDVMRQLDLDPADTTALELYNALNTALKRDDFEDLVIDKEYVLYRIRGEVISFNLIDIIENTHHQLPFAARTLAHGRRSLRGAIVDRYSACERTDAATVKNLAASAGLLLESDTAYTPLIKGNGADKMSKPYILAIGDIFSDAFITLNQEVARIETDESGETRISLPFGSKPPYDGVEVIKGVGPGPNAAVAVARLGLRAGLDSFIGDDAVGTEAIEYLQGEGVSTDTMLVEKGIKTSYYFVLRYGAERTILVKNEQFEYTWSAPKEEPEWIYLALISDASWQFHVGLLEYLEQHSNVKLAFQPGTFHFAWGTEKLAGIYKRTHILVLNREEAVDVTGRSYDSIHDLANSLHDLGPEKVVITDGPNGSYASFDGKLVTIPNYPDPAPPLDRTGAGDAFASTIVAALAIGESMETALTWAPINSASVVQRLGAQAGLLTRQELEQYIEKAPEWYRLKEMN